MEPNSVNSTIPQIPQNTKLLTLKVVIAVLLAFSLGLAVMYFWQNRFGLNCPLDLKTCPDGNMVARIPPFCNFASCPTLRPSPPVSVTPSVSADWETYRDEKNGIEFSYPRDWHAKPIPNWTFNVFLDNQPFREIPEGAEYMLVPLIQIAFNEGEDTTTTQRYFLDKTLEEGVERHKDLYDPESVKISDLTVGGRKAVQFFGIFGPGMMEGEYLMETLVQMDDKLLLISLRDKNFENIYNEILSTFKFSEAAGEG